MLDTNAILNQNRKAFDMACKIQNAYLDHVNRSFNIASTYLLEANIFVKELIKPFLEQSTSTDHRPIVQSSNEVAVAVRPSIHDVQSEAYQQRDSSS